MPSTTPIPPEQLEDVPCAMCGAKDGRILFSIRQFPVRECPRCHLRYVSPRMRAESLMAMYSNASYYKSDNSLVHGYVDYGGDRENIIRTFRERLRWLNAKVGKDNPGRLLDVGCAFGYSIEYALQQGWDAYGIEPSDHAAQAATQRLGNKVSQGTLDQHPYTKAHFDTLLLWDVIEHVPEPLVTLKQVHDLLVPGGVVSLITPDCGSLLARLMGRYWMEYAKPTEHIYFFSRKTMTQALEKCGFRVVAATTAGKHVGLDFILDRLTAHGFGRSAVKRWTRSSSLFKRPIYINPHDKMHLLAIKKS